MSVTWELSRGGDRRPLRSWGLRGAVLARRSFGADELRLDAPGLDIGSAPLFVRGATVVLWRDGVRYFTGRITSPSRFGSAQSEGHTYVASGPWWILENLRYQEERFMAIDPTDADSPLQRVFSPRAVLFNSLDGDQLTAAQQIAAALGYANARGANVNIGTVGLSVQPPWEEASSISCAEVVKRSARYAPDAVAWWNYATAKPTFRAARRADLDTVSVDLDDADRVTLVEIEPLEVVPGVKFFFEDIVELTNGKTRARYTSQSAGNPDAIGAINEVIELGAQGSDNPEPIPPDLAAAFYSAVSVQNYGGRLVLQGRDVLGDVVVGKALNIAGGQAAWETMKAPIQATTENLFAGETTVDFGVPPFLGAAAFVEFLRYSRLRNKSNYLTARRTGEGNTSAVPADAIKLGGGNYGYTDIELCDGEGGATRTLKVFGAITTTP